MVPRTTVGQWKTLQWRMVLDVKLELFRGHFFMEYEWPMEIPTMENHMAKNNGTLNGNQGCQCRCRAGWGSSPALNKLAGGWELTCDKFRALG